MYRCLSFKKKTENHQQKHQTWRQNLPQNHQQINPKINRKTNANKINKLTTKSKKKSRKGSVSSIEEEDTGIVLIDDNLTVDKEKELEERRAYLEEARSQDGD